MTTIGGVTNLTENGVKMWEKTAKDVNNIDEIFRNARDIGYTRLNQYRSTVIGKLAKNDAHDLYKIEVQSNAKLSISLRLASQKDEEAEVLESDNELLSITAPGMKAEVYMVKNGREVLVGDSSAAEGTKKRDSFDAMIKGDYKAQSGTYYVKISREKDVPANQEMAYALQLQQGESTKHDYVSKETASEDTAKNKISKTPSSLLNGTISTANAMQIQATLNQGAADMLTSGYLSFSDIKNK